MRPLLIACLAACLAACAPAPREALTVTPEAAGWRPLLLADASALLPGPPPAAGSAAAQADQTGVEAWRRPLSAPEQAVIDQWGARDPASAWAAQAEALAGSFDVAEPARAARALAHVQAACYDAVLVCWVAKGRYARPGPAGPGAGLPSYPSEDAAVAAAAAAVLARLFPTAAQGLAARARAVAEVPIATGRAFPSDVAAGLRIGEQVAQAVIARLAADEGAKPVPSRWRDPWALSPEAGAWRLWLPAGASAPASPGPPTPVELAAAHARNRAMTIRQRAIAVKWLETDQARTWHARAASLVGQGRLSAPEAARVLAYTDVALADAAIASWAAQYATGRPRPPSLDPRIEPVLPPPAHPGHPADVAAMAAAAAGYLGTAFPAEATALAHDAAEVADAGLFAGWYLDSDRAAGVRLGQAVAARVIARASEDGRP